MIHVSAYHVGTVIFSSNFEAQHITYIFALCTCPYYSSYFIRTIGNVHVINATSILRNLFGNVKALEFAMQYQQPMFQISR